MQVFVGLLAMAALAASAPVTDPHDTVRALFSEDPQTRREAQTALIEQNDPSVAPALVDAIFFNKAGRAETVAVLTHLLGEDHGASFRNWIEAIGRREDITPAPGYIRFKAELFAKIDPSFEQFLREDAPRSIRPEEIVWGGVRKDGIPALENPKTVDARRARWMLPDEQVFGVVVDGEARAYPERIVAWHEMVNDRIAGRAVSLSYCTLCGAAILYDGTASDGRTYTFGSSGLLYRSNKLMYDRQSGTLWSQFTGEPVFGTLAGKDLEPLRILPVTVTTWSAWSAMHPRTRVLSLDTGHERDYRPGAAYGKYFASPDTMFPVWKRAPGSLALKDWVLIVNAGETRKIYPIDRLEAAGLLHDRIGTEHVILIGERAYVTDGRTLTRSSDRQFVDAARGETFTMTEEALTSDSSATKFRRAPSHRAFWFGAYAFLPGAEVWQGE